MNSSRVRSVLTTVSVGCVVALGAVACGDGGSGQTVDDGTITVVVSTDVWGSVAKAVGGDRVEVLSLIDDPADDPHSYEATAEDAANVQDADLLVYNGGGYDEFFASLAEQAPDVPTVSAFDLSRLGSGEGGHDHGHESGHRHEHGHGSVNEHVWYHLPTVAKVADAVADRLGAVDEANRQRYANSASAFTGRIDELTGKVRQIRAEHGGSEVVATEPVAHYLIDAAGLTDATPPDFAEAVEEETDVPIAALNTMNQRLASGQVTAVLKNTQTVTPVIEKVVGTARKAGVPVVDVTETLPKSDKDYIAWMSGQVAALSAALSK